MGKDKSYKLVENSATWRNETLSWPLQYSDINTGLQIHTKPGKQSKTLLTISTRSFISHPTRIMASGDYRVADISLADFGRKEIEIAEAEVL